MNHVISCHGEAPFPAPSWFCVLDMAWTLSPCMNFSKVQKKATLRIVIIAKVTFFNGRFWKIIQLRLYFHILLWSLHEAMIFCSDYIYGTVTWMSNQHYFLPKACRVLDCKTVRIFAYSSTREQSNKTVWNEAEDRERDWGETLFSLASQALRACEALTPRFTDFFTDSEKKTDCFAV